MSEGSQGGPDIGELLAQAMQMQQQMVEAQAALGETEVEGQSGGGAVSIRVTGGLEFRSVAIAPDAFDPDDPDLLGDLVLAALRDAMEKVNELQAGSLGGLADVGTIGGMPDLSSFGIFDVPDDEKGV